jgi:hypothetical protein
MISPSYYVPDNLVQLYRGGRVRHFLQKPRTVTVSSREAILNFGDTLTSKAAELFGPENEFFWTIIADGMPVRYPDNYQAGDVIRLPRIVLNDYNPPVAKYAAQSTTTTPIPG